MFTILLLCVSAILLYRVVVVAIPRLKRVKRKIYIVRGIRKLEKFANRKID